MFKNASIYRIAITGPITDDMLSAQAFAPCGSTQEQSNGWVSPRGEAHGALVESVGGQLILKLMIETKSVPSQAINDATDVRIKEIEDATGRKPGKKETREIKDDVKLALLPHAFPKRVAVLGWIDRANGLLVIDSATQTRADDFIRALLSSAPGVNLSLVQTVTSPQAAMTQWLLAEDADEWPQRIAVERECVLKSTGEDAATVRFTRHHLATADVRKHVLEGKLPTQLALSWDGRLAFVLDEMLRLRKVNFLDGVLDGSDEHEDRFDADVALATGTLGPAIADLIAALGGEFVAKEAA
jgi:recombination associated protein RdgC